VTARDIMGRARLPAREGEAARWDHINGIADADTHRSVAFLDSDDGRYWWATGLLGWERADTRVDAIAAASAHLRGLGYRVEGQ
jgi:hypothetical protein